MPQAQLIAADAVAVIVLVFVLYFPRYRRRDMVVSILGVNIGVLAVATVLSSASVTAGLGLGLFGVLSIIRLRSAELDQAEIAYYFSALALGVLGGVSTTPDWVTLALMGAVLIALFVGDHPRLYPTARHLVITLDAAFTDEVALTARLESLLDGHVLRLRVKRVSLVNDTTVVDVRYRVNA
ncbi:MAG: DUF4956 domain-containing protein [Acidimicrobiales bacterium]|jgi:hypothetical protein